VYFSYGTVLIIGITSCTSSRMMRIFFFYIWFLHGFIVLSILSGCTAHVEWLYFSSYKIWTFSRMMGLFCFFLHSDFFRFSCISYNKWLHCSCQMVVLLIVKYLKFPADDKIILFSLHLVFDLISMYSLI
jgi:hypothetical protein